MRRSNLFQYALAVAIIANLLIIVATRVLQSPLGGQGLIDLASADFLGLLVILEIFPVEKEPDMKLGEPSSWTRTMKHPKGDFKVRFFGVSVKNKEGLFTKVAEAVRPSIFFPSFVQFGREEVWWYHDRPGLSADAKVNTSNPNDVSKALEQSGLFENHKLNFDPADSYVAVFAFGLSTTRHIYLATNPPMRIDADTPDQNNRGWLIRLPIGFTVSSPTLSVPPRFKLLNVIGNSWENAEARFLRLKQTQKLSNDAYAHVFEVEDPKSEG